MQEIVIIKPHAYNIAFDVLYSLDEQLNSSGQRIITSNLESVPEETISQHYLEHQGKPFYNNLVRQFAGKQVMLALYEGDTVMIPRIREICGPADPAVAREKNPNSLRALFSSDSLEIAKLENRAVDNVIHSPDSMEAAKRELQIWEQFLRH